MKKICLCIFLVCHSALALLEDDVPQSISIRGKVWQKGTKKALSNVSVFLLPQKLKVETAQDGSFVFTSVKKEDCELVINISGHERFVQSGLCQDNQENLALYVEKSNYHVFETVVSAKGKKRDEQSQALAREEFLTMPGSFGGDPVRATQNLPGVGNAGMSAQVLVQGAGPDDTGYKINGHSVPLIFHFAGLSSVIIPEAVEQVELLPSGYGPEFSGAMGGIVLLETREPEVERMHSMVYVDLLNTGFLFEGPGNKHTSDGPKSGWMVGGRYSYIGQVLKAVAKEEEDFNFTAAPTYYDFNASYFKKYNERHKSKTTFVFSRDQLDLILSKAANSDPALRGNFENRTQFYRLIPEWEWTISPDLIWNNSLGLGQDRLFVDISGKYLDVDSKTISQRSELEKVWSGQNKSFLGLDNRWYWSLVAVNLPKADTLGAVSTPFSVGEERKFVNRRHYADLAIYLRHEFKWAQDSKWTLLPNMRLEHYTLTQETKPAPRFQVRYQHDANWQWRSAWGLYHQPPLPQEVAKNYGNPSVNSPYAQHYTLGWSHDADPRAKEGLELGNDFFYKKLHDLIVPDLATNYANKGAGEVFGMQWQAKYQMENISIGASYTLLKSRRSTPGFGRHPSEFDQTHNLNLMGAYQRGKWTYGSRVRYITGSPYTPVTSASFDSDNDVYIPTRGALFSQRFDDFFQIDVRIDRKFVYDSWILTGYLDIQNLTNTSKMATAQYLDYSYDYSQTEEMNGLPILPTIGVKGEF